MATDLHSTDGLTREFEEHRAVLTSVAYRMLGRVVDAEDTVQDAWLRWASADRGDVAEPRAYLVRITTRLALDRLRQAQNRRESYVGPWLPEPLVTESGPAVQDSSERLLSAESVSMAMLVVLESLSPLERAVFVLREAFGYPYAEVARVLERGEPAVRQLGTRARRHVDSGAPRYTVDPQERRDLTERFLSAAGGGDLQALLSLLAPDVSLVGDGGGNAKAPRRIIETADKVGRFIAAVAQQTIGDGEVRLVEFNGATAVVFLVEGRVRQAAQIEVADGLIQRLYLWTNPQKVEPINTQLQRGS
ncbi:RNA polymerase sigma-70 factor [Streptomyces sp. P38-E01]|uniref:RNA polymerase sigma-70 factor n=1 Tax=Streptomyces tardus TaxID=2780544 RepID=A0A949JL85_9ACTN|nr:RNA polymerase sigma-70 factor [Streptomyces tardus]MBU7600869.1 RNA polymerase sigma-70 factor [Streptomyces tardus]